MIRIEISEEALADFNEGFLFYRPKRQALGITPSHASTVTET